MSKLQTTVELSPKFVSRIADTALTRDWTWVRDWEIEGEPKGEYPCDHIANGGALNIYIGDINADNDCITVTSDQFTAAIGKYIQMLYVDQSLGNPLFNDGADYILQLACFGEIIYD